MKLILCDCCGKELERHFRGSFLGRGGFTIKLPTYIVDKFYNGDPDDETVYDLCWQCQDNIHKAAYVELQRIKEENRERQ